MEKAIDIMETTQNKCINFNKRLDIASPYNRSARTTPIQQPATKFGKVADRVMSFMDQSLDQQDDRSLHIFIRFFYKTRVLQVAQNFLARPSNCNLSKLCNRTKCALFQLDTLFFSKAKTMKIISEVIRPTRRS